MALLEANPQTYYSTPGVMTDPGVHAALFDGLPAEVGALVQVVQGLMLHVFWAERYGEADPASFGIFDMHGLGFVAGDLLRDFLALNKVEILPWDPWGLMFGLDETPTAEHAAELDRLAELTLGGDETWPELRVLYESDERLRVPRRKTDRRLG